MREKRDSIQYRYMVAILILVSVLLVLGLIGFKDDRPVAFVIGAALFACFFSLLTVSRHDVLQRTRKIWFFKSELSPKKGKGQYRATKEGWISIENKVWAIVRVGFWLLVLVVGTLVALESPGTVDIRYIAGLLLAFLGVVWFGRVFFIRSRPIHLADFKPVFEVIATAVLFVILLFVGIATGSSLPGSNQKIFFGILIPALFGSAAVLLDWYFWPPAGSDRRKNPAYYLLAGSLVMAIIMALFLNLLPHTHKWFLSISICATWFLLRPFIAMKFLSKERRKGSIFGLH